MPLTFLRGGPSHEDGHILGSVVASIRVKTPALNDRESHAKGIGTEHMTLNIKDVSDPQTDLWKSVDRL